MGFIFCEAGQMEAAREVLAAEVVPAAAKAGTIAPLDVEIPQGPTGLEPSQTQFFQALNIPTKIVKGAIELTSPFKVCIAGEKVVLSAQALHEAVRVRYEDPRCVPGRVRLRRRCARHQRP